MPTISLRTNVLANARSGNVLAGSPFEFIAVNSIVEVVAVNPAGTPGGITADFQLGGESLAQAANISTDNAFPRLRDNEFINAGGAPGERLFLNYNNTTGAALNVDTLVQITPV